MFKRKLNNEKQIEKYIEFIKKHIIDTEIQEEIINRINIFKDNGTVIIEDKNLYAKLNKKEGKDFLEIKYINNYFICNYTNWDLKQQVTITQKDLKLGNIKINRREKNEVECQSRQNITEIEETEKIYNEENKLAYVGKEKSEFDYDTCSNYIEFNDTSYFSNYIDIEKTWYLFNGAIIKYTLRKNLIHDDTALEEHYSICKGLLEGEFQNIYYFVELDKELFKTFMTGEISINELIEKAYKNKEHKKILTPNTEWV